MCVHIYMYMYRDAHTQHVYGRRKETLLHDTPDFCINMYKWIYVYIYTFVYIFICIYMYTYVHMYIHAHIVIQIYMQTCIRTNKCTYANSLPVFIRSITFCLYHWAIPCNPIAVESCDLAKSHRIWGTRNFFQYPIPHLYKRKFTG